MLAATASTGNDLSEVLEEFQRITLRIHEHHRKRVIMSDRATVRHEIYPSFDIHVIRHLYIRNIHDRRSDCDLWLWDIHPSHSPLNRIRDWLRINTRKFTGIYVRHHFKHRGTHLFAVHFRARCNFRKKWPHHFCNILADRRHDISTIFLLTFRSGLLKRGGESGFHIPHHFSVVHKIIIKRLNWQVPSPDHS